MNVKLQPKDKLRKQFSRTYRGLYEAREEVFRQYYPTFSSKMISNKTKQQLLDEIAEQMQEMGHYSQNTARKDVKFSVIRQCFQMERREKNIFADSAFPWYDYCKEIEYNPYSRRFDLTSKR